MADEKDTDPRKVTKYKVSGTFYNPSAKEKTDKFEEMVEGEEMSEGAANSAFYQQHSKKYPHYKISSIEKQEAAKADAHADVTRYRDFVIVENKGSFDLYYDNMTFIKRFKTMAEAKAKADHILGGSRKDGDTDTQRRADGAGTRDEGASAQKAGKSRSDNPYPVGSVSARSWNNGYSEAENSKKDGDKGVPQTDTQRAGKRMDAEVLDKVADTVARIADRFGAYVDREMCRMDAEVEKTFKVFIKIKDKEREVYQKAASAEEAIKKVKETLSGEEKRWASVFV
jgi:hypothetical protein